MPIRSWSLTRLLDKGFLHSMDEEDLEALTVAIVLEVANRRQADQPLQPGAQESPSWIECSPILHEDSIGILERVVQNAHDEIQRLQERLAARQKE